MLQFLLNGSGRFAFALALLALTACGSAQGGLVPPRGIVQGQARVVSSIVTAGDQSYVVDEMYTPLESNLSGIAPGPQGDIWFTGDQPQVARSSMTGDMSEFVLPYYGNVTSIVEGPDQNLWVTLYPGAIGKVSTKGHLTAFPIGGKLGGSNSNPFSIVNGPDKALWFVTNSSTSYIVKMTLAGSMKAYRVAGASRLQWLTADKAGNLWFTDSGTNKIGRMTASGAVKEFSVPTANAGVSGICQGPDGNFWFVESGANKIGSLTSSGSFHEYDIPTAYSGAVAIVAGPDGALWFTEHSVGKIGRATTAGKIVELALSSAYPRPYQIAVGSDKNVWFTESESYGIMGRVELHNVKDSAPEYSTITLALQKGHPELGLAAKLPLAVAADDLAGKVYKGRYPYPIHLTTSDAKAAGLSQTTITSSTARASVLFSGHYTDATISANADGGGRVEQATILPSTQPEKALPNPGESLTVGPGSLLWICLQNGSIASFSMSGSVQTYPATTSFQNGCSIVEGSDGNVWFTDPNNDRIGQMTPAGQVTFFALGSEASPGAMVLGPDGALWFTEYVVNKIGRLTTQGQLTNFKEGKGGSTPSDIVAGPDGNLWYNDERGNIFKMTTAGKSTRVRQVYRIGASLWSAYGYIWFYDALHFELEEMTTEGKVLKTYAIPNGCLPFSIASGPEHSLWYVDPGNDCVARMTLSGTFSVVPTYNQGSNPILNATIVVGPNGYLWFNETGNSGLGWVDPTTM